MSMRIALDFRLEPPLLCVLGAAAYLLIGLLAAFIDERLPKAASIGEGRGSVLYNLLTWPGAMVLWCALAAWHLTVRPAERALRWLVRPKPRYFKINLPCHPNCRCVLPPLSPRDERWVVLPPGVTFAITVSAVP